MYPNGRYLTCTSGRKFGPGAGLEVYGRLQSDRLSQASGAFVPTASAPNGYGIRALVPARTPGGLSSSVSGSGQAGGPLILALQALATISGAGGITALGGLIVNLIATISGSGGVSSASMQAFLNLLATIGGTGGLTATPSGIGNVGATLTGVGTTAGSTATGRGNMAATIRGYGDLTPEGLRDAVWTAIAASNNVPGTMGAALNAAGSGGVDLNALAAAVWAYATRTLTASDMPAEQQAQILDIWQRLGLDPANPLATTTTTIQAGGVTQAVGEAAGTVTVTRAP